MCGREGGIEGQSARGYSWASEDTEGTVAMGRPLEAAWKLHGVQVAARALPEP